MEAANLAARPAGPGRSSFSPHNYSASFSQAPHEATATLTSTTEEENEAKAGYLPWGHRVAELRGNTLSPELAGGLCKGSSPPRADDAARLGPTPACRLPKGTSAVKENCMGGTGSGD